MNILPEELTGTLQELEKSITNFKTEVQSADQVLITIRSPVSKCFLAYVTVGVFLHELEPPTYAITVEAFDLIKNEKMEEFVNELPLREGDGVFQLSMICSKVASKFDALEESKV